MLDPFQLYFAVDFPGDRPRPNENIISVEHGAHTLGSLWLSCKWLLSRTKWPMSIDWLWLSVGRLDFAGLQDPALSPWINRNSCTRWVPGYDVTNEGLSLQTISTNQQQTFVGVTTTSWDPICGGIPANPGCYMDKPSQQNNVRIPLICHNRMDWSCRQLLFKHWQVHNCLGAITYTTLNSIDFP